MIDLRLWVSSSPLKKMGLHHCWSCSLRMRSPGWSLCCWRSRMRRSCCGGGILFGFGSTDGGGQFDLFHLLLPILACLIELCGGLSRKLLIYARCILKISKNQAWKSLLLAVKHTFLVLNLQKQRVAKYIWKSKTKYQHSKRQKTW